MGHYARAPVSAQIWLVLKRADPQLRTIPQRGDGKILSSITLQHFLNAYPSLCGMTGTAQPAARELKEFYGLDVVVIPTHRPMIRRDRPDRVFTHREAKESALVNEIKKAHRTERPVLVGTLSVAESERIAKVLMATGVDCHVLNAKNDAQEALIIARAGALGAVTIATNMAGRGTDIRLGGLDEAEHAQVVELGGLLVFGTNRHESQRIDQQLRGRAGRQGDPGESRFFVSLEDDLLRRYGLGELIPPALAPAPQDEPIDNLFIRREIERAQRIMEGQNFEIRRTLWRYSQPVEVQRQKLQSWRQSWLDDEAQSRWQNDPTNAERYTELVGALGSGAVRQTESLVTLCHLDRAWSEHLEAVASLREGIHLVGLGGEDPLTRFQVEIAEGFWNLEQKVDQAVLQALDRIEGDKLDLASLGIQRPASTWTYLVNDDPFRQQLVSVLTGSGGSTLAVGGAMFAGPFFLLWLVLERVFRRRRRGGRSAGEHENHAGAESRS